jgi:hypothetical protein
VSKKKGDFRSKIDSILAEGSVAPPEAETGSMRERVDSLLSDTDSSTPTGALTAPRKLPEDDPLARMLTPTTETRLDEISMSKIRSRPGREAAAGAELEDLRSSIVERGILQPLLLRPVDGGYEVVDGERRLAAARAAGLTAVPAVVRSISDEDAAASTSDRVATVLAAPESAPARSRAQKAATPRAKAAKPSAAAAPVAAAAAVAAGATAMVAEASAAAAAAPAAAPVAAVKATRKAAATAAPKAAAKPAAPTPKPKPAPRAKAAAKPEVIPDATPPAPEAVEEPQTFGAELPRADPEATISRPPMRAPDVPAATPRPAPVATFPLTRPEPQPARLAAATPTAAVRAQHPSRRMALTQWYLFLLVVAVFSFSGTNFLLVHDSDLGIRFAVGGALGLAVVLFLYIWGRS